MTVRSAGQYPQSNGSVCFSANDLGKGRAHLVVTHDEKVAAMRVEGNPGVAKVTGHNSRLILLVVVDPQFNGELSFVHANHDTTPSGFCDIARVGQHVAEAGAQGLEGRRGAVGQDDGEVSRVGECRHHFEAG